MNTHCYLLKKIPIEVTLVPYFLHSQQLLLLLLLFLCIFFIPMCLLTIYGIALHVLKLNIWYLVEGSLDHPSRLRDSLEGFIGCSV